MKSSAEAGHSLKLDNVNTSIKKKYFFNSKTTSLFVFSPITWALMETEKKLSVTKIDCR